jgi:hypothetical protein
LTANTTFSGICKKYSIIILYNYAVQARYQVLSICYLTCPGTTMSLSTDTPVAYSIWMCILVWLENAKVIEVFCCINIQTNPDSNNLIDVTPPIQIPICRWTSSQTENVHFWCISFLYNYTVSMTISNDSILKTMVENAI